ncbi:DJ-1/PfpI family protein [Bacillus sp. FJAT-49736]|uniref:DJ-1/PfpI family protein n=1 Tax=Bacillus sp. FJAT-49736 TaxID=2833582 RepID=UPI001BC92588|nr:DJ-1/PfpI family protein [Bacillus sp. FJAT-49736]MBS4174695.1 DJ-1/PfpI family protein [Bacillus sp. FJAT-49736]
MQKKVGFIVYDDFAIWQVSLLQMFLKNAGYCVETLSINGGLVPTDGGVLVHTERIDQRNPNEYAFLLLPGGKVTKDLIDNQQLHQFLQDFDGLIAASCGSSAIVAGAGLVKSDFTTMPHIKELFAEYYADGNYTDTDIVIGDKLITSKGFAHFDFMMAVLVKIGLIEANPRLKNLALKLSKNQTLNT